MLKRQLQYLATHSPFYTRKLEQAGRPDLAFGHLEDLTDLPFTVKTRSARAWRRSHRWASIWRRLRASLTIEHEHAIWNDSSELSVGPALSTTQARAILKMAGVIVSLATDASERLQDRLRILTASIERPPSVALLRQGQSGNRIGPACRSAGAVHPI